MNNATFDYVIIGAGPAGCVLAHRLTQAGSTVLLVEAGGRSRNPWLSIPIGIGKVLSDDRYSWNYLTESEPGLSGRALVWHHGRMLGGSSAINGMLFVRGEPRRFDAWRDAGCPGWGYDDVLPLFKRLESYTHGDPSARGSDGPLKVHRMTPDDPLSNGYIAAAQEAGLPFNEDYNDGHNEGVAASQFNTHNGKRLNVAQAYLGNIKQNHRLTLLEHGLVQRVSINARRATGCVIDHRGTRITVNADREVIVAAGALHSPTILEHSGIGNGERLQALGITVQRDLPGVGENLIDHLHSRVQYECTEAVTANDLMRNKWFAAKEALKYALFRKGLMRSPTWKVTAFARSAFAGDVPDMRLQLALSSGKSRDFKDGLDDFSGFHLGGYYMYPTSTGFIHITSSNPLDTPSMRANYLSTERDLAIGVEVIKYNRRIAGCPSLRSMIVRETQPGPNVDSDEALADYIAYSGQTSWHPIGTCKMGIDDNAVVDEALRVRGIDALRVADVSVMPFHVSSNTHIPAVMIGEKAADLVLGNRR